MRSTSSPPETAPPVCVPLSQADHRNEFLTRADNIRRTDRPLEIILHVGTEEERLGLLGASGKKTGLSSRIQNASLDTMRQNEAIMSYYMREQLPVLMRSFQVRYPFRSRLHSLFPWLFITNGIPVASVLAGVWLFVDPYYNTKFLTEYNRYFTRILEGVDWAYHNIIIRVETDPALGHINHRIAGDDDGSAYRQLASEAGRYGLPVSVTDRLILNNLTTETSQLEGFKREANSFTTIPFYFFTGKDENGGGFKSYEDLFGKEERK